MHDSIISLRRKVWPNKTSLTPPLFIEVPVPSQESERYIYVQGIDFSLSAICILDFGIVRTFYLKRAYFVSGILVPVSINMHEYLL